MFSRTAISVPAFAPSSAVRELSGPPNWLKPKSPRAPAVVPEPVPPPAAASVDSSTSARLGGAVAGAVPGRQDDRGAGGVEAAEPGGAEHSPVGDEALAAEEVLFRGDRRAFFQRHVGVARHEVRRRDFCRCCGRTGCSGVRGQARDQRAGFGGVGGAGADDETAVGVDDCLQARAADVADIIFEELLGAGGQHIRGRARRGSRVRRRLGRSGLGRFRNGRGGRDDEVCRTVLVELRDACLQPRSAAFNDDFPAGQADSHVAGDCAQDGNGVGCALGLRACRVEFRHAHAEVPADGLCEAAVTDVELCRINSCRVNSCRSGTCRSGGGGAGSAAEAKTVVPAIAGTAANEPASAMLTAMAARATGWNFGVFTPSPYRFSWRCQAW